MGGGKCIQAGSNLNGCCLLLTLHSTYSHSRRKRHSSFSDSISQSRGNDHGCSRIRRDAHGEVKSIAIDLPAGGDLAIERLIGRGGEGQPSSWLWLEHNM